MNKKPASSVSSFTRAEALALFNQCLAFYLSVKFKGAYKRTTQWQMHLSELVFSGSVLSHINVYAVGLFRLYLIEVVVVVY